MTTPRTSLRANAPAGAIPGSNLADRIGQRVGQDYPQPGQMLRIGRTAELISILVRLEHRLLHQVRGIELALNLRRSRSRAESNK